MSTTSPGTGSRSIAATTPPCGSSSQAGGAGCITAASNVGSAVSATVYRDWDKASSESAQATLAAIRAAVTSAPLISALKALVARNTGDEAWLNMRPPHLRLSGQAAAKLFAAFDDIGFTLADAA
jgi:4-hydroxy-tetrahydrodipicolinate synthase